MCPGCSQPPAAVGAAAAVGGGGGGGGGNFGCGGSMLDLAFAAGGVPTGLHVAARFSISSCFLGLMCLNVKHINDMSKMKSC